MQPAGLPDAWLGGLGVAEAARFAYYRPGKDASVETISTGFFCPLQAIEDTATLHSES